MSREVPFDSLAICDVCGNIGAFDFMGDLICQHCLDELDKDYSNEADDEEEDEREIR